MPKKTLSIVTSLIFSANAILMAVVVPQAEASFEPYQKTFIVTAYYSPLPGQSFYVTGSLASDKRLNGNGTHGADGTPVYPGMIAAPGTYSFGTRVSCPGYIDGEIHDRGGAIVKAGERGYAHDRLDFWAGFRHARAWICKALAAEMEVCSSAPIFFLIWKRFIDGCSNNSIERIELTKPPTCWPNFWISQSKPLNTWNPNNGMHKLLNSLNSKSWALRSR